MTNRLAKKTLIAAIRLYAPRVPVKGGGSMAESLGTQASLLLRIRDAQDHEAWSQFVAVYAPLVFGYVRKHGHGLQDEDAADLTQEVLSVVARSAREFEYDPGRGSFRGWLFTVTRNKLLNFLARQAAQPRGSGDTGDVERLKPQPAREEQDVWDRDYRQRLFDAATEQVRKKVEERAWQAFWLTAIESKPAKPVAAELGMTVAAVRLAKSRIMAQIRKCIQELEVE
jgi:RNA polymerase sigma-70 factor (ECF subfamily)